MKGFVFFKLQSTNPSSGITGIQTMLEVGLLSPMYLRKFFERMGATYIKLGQVTGATYDFYFVIISY